MSTTSLPQDYLDRFGGVARLVGAAGLSYEAKARLNRPLDRLVLNLSQ